MRDQQLFSEAQLLSFLDRAGKATYAGDGKQEVQPERPGFVELTYQEGDFSYRDSYTGYYRSRGMEVVRFQGKPVWTSMYGGGVITGKEQLAHQCFSFLKQALRSQEDGFVSFRGAHMLEAGDWKHIYKQAGDWREFSGYEEIFYKGEVVFFHRIIGGVVEDKGLQY